MQSINDFDYNLPKNLIAVNPVEKRGNSKLLVINRKTQELFHKKYSDFIDYLNNGDVLVLNNVKVIPARLYVSLNPNHKNLPKIDSQDIEQNVKALKSKIEILLIRQLESGFKWECLIGNSKKLKDQKELYINGNTIQIQEKLLDGRFIIYCENILEIANKFGHIPLPKYIKRQDNSRDKIRYQTVFAQVPGAVAAPTASLNLTKNILDKLKQKGVKIVYITLYVGLGTFAPIRSDFIEEHSIHKEYAVVSKSSAKIINEAKIMNKKICAIGTTVTRTLEGVYQKYGKLKEYSGDIDIYIYPSYKFKIIDILLTNFHAPKTTVLVLASAFVGKYLLLKAYEQAIKNNYRFLSYGDSTLIL